MATLTVTTSDGEEMSFEVSAPKTSIGRGPSNHIVVPDNSLSTRHAEIANEGGQFTITDLESTNGIQVNENPVESSPLADGDRLMLGHVSGIFSNTPAGTKPMPEESSIESASTASTARPSSAFGKKVKEKDSKAQALLSLGIFAIVVAVGAILLSFTMSA